MATIKVPRIIRSAGTTKGTIGMEHPEKGPAIVEQWDVERMESHGFKRIEDRPKRKPRATKKSDSSGEQED